MSECATCGGSGQSDEWRCGDCNYEPYVTSITDVNAGPPKPTCPHCKGDYTWTRDPCPDCHGTGSRTGARCGG